jgi:hypothetical protein
MFIFGGVMKEPNWKNRIVREEWVDPNQLIANPFNVRVHSLKQRSLVEESLSEFGWIDRIIVNDNTGNVIDGHLRVSSALAKNIDVVPVVYVDLSEEEEKLAILLFDQLTSLASLDLDYMNEVLADMNIENEPLRDFLEDIAEGKEGDLNLEDPGEIEGLEVDLDEVCLIEIRCTLRDMHDFQGTLRRWDRRPTVEVSFG